MFFDTWNDLLRIAVLGVCGYAALILLLRISGKRTLAKLNAFDFVVTVALGSTLATVLLSSDVSLVDGVAALAVLIGMQYAVTWSSVRSTRVRRFVRSEPTLVLYRGRLLPDALRRERLTESEVFQVLRQQGKAAVADVPALVFETDGSFSLVSDTDGPTLPPTPH
ncbi:MAG TPA: YetF domain-containing protein [Mycobacteriales bacterium]